jgi:hypothetical protein
MSRAWQNQFAMKGMTSLSQQADIDLYLRLNGVGRGRLRYPNVTINEWIEILARHSDDLDITRHLLQEVPYRDDSISAKLYYDWVYSQKRLYYGSHPSG